VPEYSTPVISANQKSVPAAIGVNLLINIHNIFLYVEGKGIKKNFCLF
jgi:hypothetical protein